VCGELFRIIIFLYFTTLTLQKPKLFYSFLLKIVNMAIEIDTIDRKILIELDKNARISYSELGKRIRVAKETVKYRITQLEKKGIISGYYTVINLSKLGFVLYRLYLRLQNTSPKIEQMITDYLLRSKNVAVFYRASGPFHIALGVWTRNAWECEDFWLDFKSKFGEYISNYHLSLMTEYTEFSRTYLLPTQEKMAFNTITKATSEKLDKLDLNLISFLSNNARASLVEIAKKLGSSIITSRYHLKNLINKKVILGFRPIFNLAALGYEYYKVDLWFKKFDHAKDVVQHILSHPNVIYTEHTLITSDLEFDVEIENFEKFIAMMDSFKAKFPDDIKDYKYYERIRNYKTNYVPSL